MLTSSCLLRLPSHGTGGRILEPQKNFTGHFVHTELWTARRLDVRTVKVVPCERNTTRIFNPSKICPLPCEHSQLNYSLCGVVVTQVKVKFSEKYESLASFSLLYCISPQITFYFYICFTLNTVTVYSILT